MGLAKRIIPVILHKNGLLVKGQKFVNDRVIGNALQAAKIHAMRGVDEILILDVTATEEGREPNYDLIKKLCDTCTIPVTVGGGVKTAEHVKQLLRSGADKVAIGDSARKYPGLIKLLSEQFGSSTITMIVDIPAVGSSIYRHGIELCYETAALIAQAYEEEGAGELLLQCPYRDGLMTGYDLDLIASVSNAVTIPVVASCGCSSYADMYNAIRAGADAVAAGALFAFTDATPKGAAEYLHAKGVEVRLV